MKARHKDILFTGAVIAAIIALGIVVVNLDSLFSTGAAQQSLEDLISSSVDYNITPGQDGTSPNASVTLMEFTDFKCPYCRMAAFEVIKVHAAFGDQVNIVMRHMPSHPGSQEAAEAAECSKDQGMFMEYTTLLWGEEDYSKSALIGYAEQMGMDRTLFSTCLLGRKKRAVINEHIQEAKLLGVQGTPIFFVNNKKMMGFQKAEALAAAIQEELEK